MSVQTDSNNINFVVWHRVLSQSVYALLSLIKAILNMSTNIPNPFQLGKTLINACLRKLAVSTGVNYDIIHFRLLCKEYLTLI